MTFHQTTPMEPRPLREAIEQARRQEDAVRSIFLRLRRPLTPSDVYRMTRSAGRDWSAASTMEVMARLSEDGGALERTTATHAGPDGLECYWQLSEVP
jgi:hypothetical protein